jgi:hypothetical protein
LNRQSWTYLDDQNRAHQVALFHSPRDGKLLIQVDGQTVVATIHAQRGGRWTFLIEEELCDVVLARRGLEFSYYFEVNHRADTPRNRAWKTRERKDFWLPTGIFLAAILLITSFLFVKHFEKRKTENRKIRTSLEIGAPEQLDRLILNNKRTFAKLQNSDLSIKYSFAPDSSLLIEGTFILTKNKKGKWLLPNGFPCENGDEFLVKYLPENPHVFKLDLMQPTENQLVRYLERAAEVQQKCHPEESKSASICLVELASQRTGLRGLADVFYQEKMPSENPEHNRETYNRLVRDENFKKLRDDKCWGK